MKKKKRFCRKCGTELIYDGRGDYADRPVFNRKTGERELAEIFVCPKNSWLNSYTHDEFRTLNGMGYYYF